MSPSGAGVPPLQLFSAFHCPGGRRLFSLPFAALLDTLLVFASAPGAELDLRYPGPNQELTLEYAPHPPFSSLLSPHPPYPLVLPILLSIQNGP